MSEDLDGILEHRKLVKGNQWNVSNQRIFDIVIFPYSLSVLVLLYSKPIDDSGNDVKLCDLVLDMHFMLIIPISDITF